MYPPLHVHVKLPSVLSQKPLVSHGLLEHSFISAEMSKIKMFKGKSHISYISTTLKINLKKINTKNSPFPLTREVRHMKFYQLIPTHFYVI